MESECQMIYYQMGNGYCDPNKHDQLISYDSHSHWLSDLMIKIESEAKWYFKHNLSVTDIDKLQTNNIIKLCHGSWIEDQATIKGAGFEPVPQCKEIQVVPDKENGGINMPKSSVTNDIEDESSSLSCNTNKVICYNRHIALNSQVSTATLDSHMVNSSGYKNDQVFCINNAESINTLLQKYSIIENVYSMSELLNESNVYSFNQSFQHGNTGTCQSHNSTCVQIDKLQSFSQILLDNFILFNQSLYNSLVNHDSTTKEALFSDTLVNESTWILHTQAHQRECQLVDSCCDHKVVGGT